MHRPDVQALFALYHLGLDGSGVYRFRNLADCARHCQVPAGQLQRWLQDDRIDADAVKSVAFNLTRYHVDAQFVAPEHAGALIAEAYRGFRDAQRQTRGRSGGEFVHDVNYDDIWGDGYRGPD